VSKKEATPKVPDYRALRAEKVTIEGVDIDLVAGKVYGDLPPTAIETLAGEYGALEEVPEGTLEVLTEDGDWEIAPEEEAADG
jgi:hypothetical protein